MTIRAEQKLVARSETRCHQESVALWDLLAPAGGQQASSRLPHGAPPPPPKERIPKEIAGRAGTESVLSGWLTDIPADAGQIDEAVHKARARVPCGRDQQHA